MQLSPEERSRSDDNALTRDNLAIVDPQPDDLPSSRRISLDRIRQHDVLHRCCSYRQVRIVGESILHFSLVDLAVDLGAVALHGGRGQPWYGERSCIGGHT
jgi:hypothetical protein